MIYRISLLTLLLLALAFNAIAAIPDKAEDKAVDQVKASSVYIAGVQLPEILQKQKLFNSDRLTEVMAVALTEATGFEARTEADLKGVLKKMEFAQQVGDDDLVYQASLAKLSRSELLFRTSINLVNGRFLMSASLIDYNEGRVINRQSASFSYPNQAVNTSRVVVYRVVGLEKRLNAQAQPEPISGGILTQEVVGQDGSQAERPFVSPKAQSATHRSPSKGLVILRANDLLDAEGAEALERRLALRLSKEQKLNATAKSEVADMLAQEERLQLMTETDSASLSRITEKLDAGFLAVLSIGKVGDKVVISGSLIDTKEQAGVARSSIMLPDAEQLAEGAEVVALALVGIDIPLPKPEVKPNRFQSAMAKLERATLTGYEPYLDNDLAGLAILPFAEYGDEAQARKLGEASAGYLRDQMQKVYNLPVTPKARLDALKEKRDLSKADTLPIDDLREIGRFLGASVIAVGRVTELADDFMISMRLIDTGLGQTVGAGHTFFPMGERGTLMKKAFVVKTKAGAIYRSIIPGWGQFYNGPKHYWKGGLVVSGILASIAAGTALVVVADDKRSGTAAWDRGGDQFFQNNCGADPRYCVDKINGIESDADKLLYGGIAAFSTAGVIWLIGIIDAAVHGEDFSEAVYGAQP